MASGETTDSRLAAVRKRTFYANWLSRTFGGTKGVLGDLSLFLGIVLAVAHARYPKTIDDAVRKIPGLVGYEDFVALVPLALASLYLVFRFFAAPWWIFKECEAEIKRDSDEAINREQAVRAELDRERKVNFETIGRLQQQIARLEAPAPRVTVRFTGNSRTPLALRNVGPVEAHRVKISDIGVGRDYVEFEEVDPLESNGPEKTPDFRVLTRGQDAVSPLKMTEFAWFLRDVSEAETYAVWREAAGLPAVNFAESIEAFKETLELGPPKHPLKISYTDATGARRFETTYTWHVDRGGEEMVLGYDGWREIADR